MSRELLAVGGVLAALTLFATSTSGGRAAVRHLTGGPVSDLDRHFTRALEHVAITEGRGRYDAVNPNADNAGMSWGLIQWAQYPGSLGRLLNRMYKTNPALFAETFGPHWRELLVATREKGVRPVAGRQLWESPWLERFKAAGANPVWQQVQRDEAKATYWPAAVHAAQATGQTSLRALTLFLDTAVQQGSGFARRAAARVQAALQRGDVQPADALRAFAALTYSHHRRTEEPTSPHPSAPRIVWKKVDGEWHAVAGKFDLYRAGFNRRSRILQAPELSEKIA